MQFFLYGIPGKGCALANWEPNDLALAPAFQTGLKNNATIHMFRGFTGQTLTAKNCKKCYKACKDDPNCKYQVFIKSLKQCSLMYGEGPYIEWPVPWYTKGLKISTSYDAC